MELDSESIGALRELIQVNLDGFGERSLGILNPDCRNLCFEIASRRRDHADLLLRHLHLSEEAVRCLREDEHTSRENEAGARFELAFFAVHDWLAEAEQGEQVLEQCYERAFEKLSDTAFRRVLGAQCREVRRDHQRLMALSAKVAQSR
jgi:hypothetical protein